MKAGRAIMSTLCGTALKTALFLERRHPKMLQLERFALPRYVADFLSRAEIKSKKQNILINLVIHPLDACVSNNPTVYFCINIPFFCITSRFSGLLRNIRTDAEVKKITLKFSCHEWVIAIFSRNF